MKFLISWNKSFNSKNYRHKLKTSLSASLIHSSVDDTILLHNKKTFLYFKKYSQQNKIPYYQATNYEYLNKLICLNTKNGKKQQTRFLFSSIFKNIYNKFSSFNTELYLDYPNYNIFFDFSKNFPIEFYKFDFIIKSIYTNLEFIFILKKQKLKRRKKKKLPPKLIFSYVAKTHRQSLTLRILNTYFNNYDLYTKQSAYTNAILYLLLTQKQSFLYKKKLSMYIRLLEKKKFY